MKSEKSYDLGRGLLFIQCTHVLLTVCQLMFVCLQITTKLYLPENIGRPCRRRPCVKAATSIQLILIFTD